MFELFTSIVVVTTNVDYISFRSNYCQSAVCSAIAPFSFVLSKVSVVNCEAFWKTKAEAYL